MSTIEKLLREIALDVRDLLFPDILLHARTTLGMHLYTTAEHMGISMNRLFNLEKGLFRAMVRDQELEKISVFYGFQKNFLKNKAIEYIKTFRKGCKADVYFQ